MNIKGRKLHRSYDSSYISDNKNSSIDVDKKSISRIRTTKYDKEIERVDDASLVLMIFIAILLFAIGVGVGYLLYVMVINGNM